MRLLLTRDLTGKSCTMGRLYVGDEKFHTIERPWIPGPGKGGAKGISCVPAGAYRLMKHNSEAHSRTWALVNPLLDVVHLEVDTTEEKRHIVRTVVLIHVANFAAELRGCIAPGMEASDNMVKRSREAMRRIQEILPWTGEHDLDITYTAGAAPR